MKRHKTGISVSGIGEATTTPDLLTVDLGVSVLEQTVEAATNTAADAALAVISSLVDAGVDKSDITTIDYSIHAEQDWQDNQRRHLGYRVTNTVRAKIRDVAAAGNVLDSTVSAGGDRVQVNNLRFSVEDETGLRSEARSAAWEDAVARATELAGLAGLTLGSAVEIVEGGGPSAPFPIARMQMAAEASTPIEPGTSAVRVALHVRFAVSD